MPSTLDDLTSRLHASVERERRLWDEIQRLRHRYDGAERENALLKVKIGLMEQLHAMPPAADTVTDTAVMAMPSSEPPVRSRRLTRAEKEEVDALLRQGVKRAVVAKQFGVTFATISRYYHALKQVAA